MTPIKIVSISVAALVRTVAIMLAIRGIYGMIIPFMMIRGGAGGRPSEILIYYGLPTVAAVVLWMLSKPIASLVVRDLDTDNDRSD